MTAQHRALKRARTDLRSCKQKLRRLESADISFVKEREELRAASREAEIRSALIEKAYVETKTECRHLRHSCEALTKEQKENIKILHELRSLLDQSTQQTTSDGKRGGRPKTVRNQRRKLLKRFKRQKGALSESDLYLLKGVYETGIFS